MRHSLNASRIRKCNLLVQLRLLLLAVFCLYNSLNFLWLFCTFLSGVTLPVQGWLYTYDFHCVLVNIHIITFPVQAKKNCWGIYDFKAWLTRVRQMQMQAQTECKDCRACAFGAVFKMVERICFTWVCACVCSVYTQNKCKCQEKEQKFLFLAFLMFAFVLA